MKLKSPIVRFWACVAAFLTAQGVHSSAPGHDEYAVKAAMLVNFAKFVKWPASAFSDSRSSFVIAVYGDDPFGRHLDDVVKGQQLDGRPISIRRVRKGSVDTSAHLLFVADKSTKSLKDLSICGGKPILMVGESESFVKSAGHIGFVMENQRIAFVINNRIAQSAGLTISSKLLNLAKRVDL